MRKLRHDEIAAKRFPPDRLHAMDRFPIQALLDNVRSLYNVGAIFRASDGARISTLHLTGYTPYPPRKEIEKTALGATSTVPWNYQNNAITVLESLKKNGITICVLEQTNQSIPYFELPLSRFPLCLVVGNEITGISKEIINQADIAIDIPMYGLKQSLNVAVAYGIVVYDFVRRLHEQLIEPPK